MTMTRKTLKLTLTGAFVACAVGGIALRDTRATPPTQGFASTALVGPAVLDDIDTKAETDDWDIELMTKGLSDVYMTYFRLAPGANGGWHSHPGPSIIAVKSGTATFYDECNDFAPLSYPAGTGFVEDAGCVHLLANQGNVDLEVLVTQIVPRGAPRRIDEPNPLD
jgi:quercetin dioxygenase-like cupin family protein